MPDFDKELAKQNGMSDAAIDCLLYTSDAADE